MHPKYYNEVLGKKFTQDVLRGTPLKADMIEK
jgi:sialic acid synthase SpsE